MKGRTVVFLAVLATTGCILTGVVVGLVIRHAVQHACEQLNGEIALDNRNAYFQWQIDTTLRRTALRTDIDQLAWTPLADCPGRVGQPVRFSRRLPPLGELLGR
jgi:hypothetical protein